LDLEMLSSSTEEHANTWIHIQNARVNACNMAMEKKLQCNCVRAIDNVCSGRIDHRSEA